MRSHSGRLPHRGVPERVPLRRRHGRARDRHRDQHRRGHRGVRPARRRRRDRHHRHVRLDERPEHRGRQVRGAGGGRPDRRRHVVRDHRRQPRGQPRVPVPERPGRDRADGARRARGGQARHLVHAALGRHRDEHLAAAGRRDLRDGPAGGAEARDPAHRRPQRVRAARRAVHARSRRHRALPVRRARRRRPAGRSPSCARSPPRCWAPSTSSGTRRTSPRTSRRW